MQEQRLSRSTRFKPGDHIVKTIEKDRGWGELEIHRMLSRGRGTEKYESLEVQNSRGKGARNKTIRCDHLHQGRKRGTVHVKDLDLFIPTLAWATFAREGRNNKKTDLPESRKIENRGGIETTKASKRRALMAEKKPEEGGCSMGAS